MTNEEAKVIIKDYVMNKYSTWMQDMTDLTDKEFGYKYGWSKPKSFPNYKDSIKAVTDFQKYFFDGATAEGWEKIGVDRQTVWSLKREGWLSEWQSWKSNSKTVYFLTQQRMKEIWRECHTN